MPEMDYIRLFAETALTMYGTPGPPYCSSGGLDEETDVFDKWCPW